MGDRQRGWSRNRAYARPRSARCPGRAGDRGRPRATPSGRIARIHKPISGAVPAVHIVSASERSRGLRAPRVASRDQPSVPQRFIGQSCHHDSFAAAENRPGPYSMALREQMVAYATQARCSCRSGHGPLRSSISCASSRSVGLLANSRGPPPNHPHLDGRRASAGVRGFSRQLQPSYGSQSASSQSAITGITQCLGHPRSARESSRSLKSTRSYAVSATTKHHRTAREPAGHLCCAYAAYGSTSSTFRRRSGAVPPLVHLRGNLSVRHSCPAKIRQIDSMAGWGHVRAGFPAPHPPERSGSAVAPHGRSVPSCVCSCSAERRDRRLAA